MDWFRSFHGAPVDPTWRLIAKKAGVRTGDVALVWWGLMDYASQQKDRGSVQGFDPEVYAAAWDIEEDVIRKILGALEEKGKIDADKITAWEKRNPKREDDSSDRVKRFREKSNAVKRDVTRGNSRGEESREEKKETPIAPKGADRPRDFDSFWTLYPEKVGKDAALKAWNKRKKAGDLPALEILVEAIGRYINAKPADRAYCNPSTWLNQGRWQDVPATASPAGTTTPTKALTDDDWRSALRRFQADHKWPAVGYGPQPGYGGCVVPTQILAEFNLESRAA